jgi:hypothetical protein
LLEVPLPLSTGHLKSVRCKLSEFAHSRL